MAWNGIGITAGQPYGSWFEFNSATHAAISAPFLPQITQFPRMRTVSQTTSATSLTATHLWAQDVKTYSPTTFIHYGCTYGAAYLPTYYSTYLPLMLAEAQWAQDNGMDEFQLGNEFEISGNNSSISVSSLTRSSNVVTAVCAVAHGLQTGDTITISGATPSNMNVSQVACTVTDSVTLTYLATGTDGSATGTLKLNAGEATIIRFVKLLAAQAQAVFTRGNITYSVSKGHQTNWTSITPGVDLDTIGLDYYEDAGYDDFVTNVTNMYNIFGTKMYLSEFGLNTNWPAAKANGYGVTTQGFDKAQSDEISKLLSFIKGLGIPQAYFFSAWDGNNNFSAYYNTSSLHGNFSGPFVGGWKSVRDALLERKKTNIFLGTQQAATTSPNLAYGQPVSIGIIRRSRRDFGTALDFRSGGIVKFGTGNPFSNAAGFYISFWVKWFGPNGAYQHILAKRDSYGTTTMMVDISINPSTGDLQLDTGSGQKDFGVNLPLYQWVHGCYVHNLITTDLQEQLYLDGQRVYTAGVTGQGTGTGALLTIGAAEVTAIEPFNGFIDEVVVGTGTSSWLDVVAMQRRFIYNNQFAYFKFDEATGNTALDSSGNGNNGIITTATYIRDLSLRG